METKIRINMLSSATDVPGQGVASAYIEQVEAVKANSDVFDIEINSKHSNFDIYHIHSPNPTYYLRMNKKHINIVYVHLLPSTLDKSIKLPKPLFLFFKKYIKKMYLKADELVVVNSAFIPGLLDLGAKKENITYIPNYVDNKRFYKLDKNEVFKLKEKYQINKEKFVVLGCGQIQTRKGVKDFIELSKLLPDVQFIWAGGFSFGKITDGYKELKRLVDNPPKNVKFLGIIERNKMNEIFNICNVLFMPSFEELFPMSVLEAANCEVPILLRDTELYKNILFDKYLKGKSLEDWKNVILKLQSNLDFYKESVENSKFISQYYSKDKLKTMWRHYYIRIYNKYKKTK